MRALVLSRSLRNTIRSFVRQDAECSVTASARPAGHQSRQTLGRAGNLCCSLERSDLVRCFEQSEVELVVKLTIKTHFSTHFNALYFRSGLSCVMNERMMTCTEIKQNETVYS